MSLPGLNTDPEDSGASDGAVGIDYGWNKKLEKGMKDTPLAASLIEAIQGMRDLDGKVDVDLLEEIVKGKCEEWKDFIYSPAAGFNLPASYWLDFAIAIYVYTLNDPAVYAVVNGEMFNTGRRKPGAISGISASLRACLPYIKFLDAALAALPNCYVFRGEVRRGTKWVYPSPTKHDPESHFPVGQTIMWYEFKSTSTQREVMMRDHFCGVNAGPRTIFTVKATRAYDIHKFSYFQGTDSEHEVLFRPFCKFKVLNALKNIIDAKELVSNEKSGFPDVVQLQQVCDAEEEMLRARDLQESEDARIARSLHAEEVHYRDNKPLREALAQPLPSPANMQGTRQERGVCPVCGEAVYSDQDRVNVQGVYYHTLCNQEDTKEKALREQESDNMRKLREMAFDRPMPGEAGAGEALIAAAWANNVEDVRRLNVHRDPTVLEYRDAQGGTALNVSSLNGHVDVVRALLMLGANVNAATNEGSTALTLSSQYGHVDVVRALLQKGANVNAATNEGLNALAYATQFGHGAVANVLLQHGAQMPQQQCEGGYDVPQGAVNGVAPEALQAAGPQGGYPLFARGPPYPYPHHVQRTDDFSQYGDFYDGHSSQDAPASPAPPTTTTGGYAPAGYSDYDHTSGYGYGGSGYTGGYATAVYGGYAIGGYADQQPVERQVFTEAVTIPTQYDPMTMYEVVLTRATGQFVGPDGLSGVGISFAVFPDGATSKVVIMNIAPGGPAAISNQIVAQHELVAVNNEDVRSKTVEEITRLIKGTPNSPVKLTLLPALSGMGGSGYSGYGYGVGLAAGAGFGALDENKDGVISQGEWAAAGYGGAAFANLDRDGDDVVMVPQTTYQARTIQVPQVQNVRVPRQVMEEQQVPYQTVRYEVQAHEVQVPKTVMVPQTTYETQTYQVEGKTQTVQVPRVTMVPETTYETQTYQTQTPVYETQYRTVQVPRMTEEIQQVTNYVTQTIQEPVQVMVPQTQTVNTVQHIQKVVEYARDSLRDADHPGLSSPGHGPQTQSSPGHGPQTVIVA